MVEENQDFPNLHKATQLIMEELGWETKLLQSLQILVATPYRFKSRNSKLSTR